MKRKYVWPPTVQCLFTKSYVPKIILDVFIYSVSCNLIEEGCFELLSRNMQLLKQDHIRGYTVK